MKGGNLFDLEKNSNSIVKYMYQQYLRQVMQSKMDSRSSQKTPLSLPHQIADVMFIEFKMRMLEEYKLSLSPQSVAKIQN